MLLFFLIEEFELSVASYVHSPQTNLGHYEILSQLGAGGMGEVYLARDKNLDRLLALKVLAAKVNNDKRRRMQTALRFAVFHGVGLCRLRRRSSSCRMIGKSIRGTPVLSHTRESGTGIRSTARRSCISSYRKASGSYTLSS